ncbi:hypothetical protein HY408_00165 [Candidatus Gottesmanbacteria bacterium]|nr:hypothetical protein [Candidatus Gottesmanbacteria bacterium]
MDTTQLLLVVVISVLTILLSIIGVQVIFILAEFRRTVEKVNNILDDAEVVSSGVHKSFVGMAGLMEGFKTGLSVVHLFGKRKKKA